MWRFMICTFAKYIWGNEIDQNGMAGACDTRGVNESCTQEFGKGTWGKDDTLKVYRQSGQR